MSVLDHVQVDDDDGFGISRRKWDDDFVLKSQFAALLPAFDPRPGRTNVPQTQDFNVPPPGTGLFDFYSSVTFSK